MHEERDTLWHLVMSIVKWRESHYVRVLDMYDKLRYFAITEFNNCFIIRSSFFCYQLNMSKSLSACSGTRSAIFTQERSFNYAWAKYLQQNTYWAICRSRGELSPMKRQEKIHRMITQVNCRIEPAYRNNACYYSWARRQSSFCLQLHANEATGSIQWKMTH